MVSRKLVSIVVALPLVTACGGGTAPKGFDPQLDAGGSDAGAKRPADDDGGVPTNPTGGILEGDAEAPRPPSEVYGHSFDTLYKLDPDTKAVSVVGKFDGCTSVIDIALDKSSNLYGATPDALWKIDRATAKCTRVASGSYPNSLSFVPAGTLDPAVEALVGYEGAQYVRIDPASGAKSPVGTIGGGFSSSGDIVSVKGGGTYLTVKGPSCSDCLIEVDPATGALMKNWGPLTKGDVFGLAFWAGHVYGFDNAGELFEVSFDNGQLSTSLIPIPGKPPTLSFWGAGSTTSAPPNVPR